MFLMFPHTYGHVTPSLTWNVHQNPFDYRAASAAIGLDVSARNRNLQLFNISSFLINPPILPSSSVICRRAFSVSPCSRSSAKWESIQLGNTAYLHFLQMTTWNSGKWLNCSISAHLIGSPWCLTTLLAGPYFYYLFDYCLTFWFLLGWSSRLRNKLWPRLCITLFQRPPL